MNRHPLTIRDLLIGFISFILLWQTLHATISTRIIPGPIDVIAYTLKVPGLLLLHSGASVLRITAALSISLIIGIPMGILLGENTFVRRLFSPLLYFIYPIPKVAFLPVLMLMYGLGNASKIILIIWIIVFQIILSVRDGVDGINPVNLIVMEGLCATSLQKYRFLILPAILPHIFSGLRISIGISMASLFFAENYATTYGIGYYILSAWTNMDYTEMFSGILVLGLLGLVLFRCIDALEASMSPWHK